MRFNYSFLQSESWSNSQDQNQRNDSNLQKQMDKKSVEIDTVATALNQLRAKNGIVDFKNQVPEITRGYMTALATGRGSTSDTKKIKKL